MANPTPNQFNGEENGGQQQRNEQGMGFKPFNDQQVSNGIPGQQNQFIFQNNYAENSRVQQYYFNGSGSRQPQTTPITFEISLQGISWAPQTMYPGNAITNGTNGTLMSGTANQTQTRLGQPLASGTTGFNFGMGTQTSNPIGIVRPTSAMPAITFQPQTLNVATGQGAPIVARQAADSSSALKNIEQCANSVNCSGCSFCVPPGPTSSFSGCSGCEICMCSSSSPSSALICPKCLDSIM